MNYLDFTDRTSYLAARTAWRVEYASLSQEIRDLKTEIRTIQREKGSGYAYSEQADKAYNRNVATRMLATRKQMKEKSGEMRAARLAERENA